MTDPQPETFQTILNGLRPEAGASRALLEMFIENIGDDGLLRLDPTQAVASIVGAVSALENRVLELEDEVFGDDDSGIAGGGIDPVFDPANRP